jgi:hypothetical protein
MCSKETSLSDSIHTGYREFCSITCCARYNQKISAKTPRTLESKLKQKNTFNQFLKSSKGKKYLKNLSISRIGKNNPCHRQTKETKANGIKKQSETMKLKIKNGEFTPCITNSWCHSKIEIHNIPFRSCWEAAFYILNPNLEYEKVRIPFIDEKGNEKIYITDFVNYIDKKIYEIKPKSVKKEVRNILKEKAAIKWCNDNGYQYICISNEYFLENAYKIDYTLFDLKLKKSMKQFLNEN